MAAIFRLVPSELKALVLIRGSMTNAKIQIVIASQVSWFLPAYQLPAGQRLEGVVCSDIAFFLSARCHAHSMFRDPKDGFVSLTSFKSHCFSS